MEDPTRDPWAAPPAAPVPSALGKFEVSGGIACLAVGAFGEVMATVAPNRAVGGSPQLLLMGVFFVALGLRTLLDTHTAPKIAGHLEPWLRGRAASRILTVVALIAAVAVIAFSVSAVM
jgi:hypothetical protein